MPGRRRFVALPGSLIPEGQYGNSGVMTFILNHDGMVYEKDLGPDTEKIAKKMKAFDPDSGWKKEM